jgi:hypothetical protein
VRSRCECLPFLYSGSEDRSGVGASGPQRVFQRWVSGYLPVRIPGVALNYQTGARITRRGPAAPTLLLPLTIWTARIEVREQELPLREPEFPSHIAMQYRIAMRYHITTLGVKRRNHILETSPHRDSNMALGSACLAQHVEVGALRLACWSWRLGWRWQFSRILQDLGNDLSHFSKVVHSHNHILETSASREFGVVGFAEWVGGFNANSGG